MFKKSIFAVFVCMFLISAFYIKESNARPSWISAAYSGWTVQRNTEVTDPNLPGYYYTKIIATCTNNSTDKIVTGIVDRRMGFNAQAFSGQTPLNYIASGNTQYSGTELVEDINPGESFKVTYLVPITKLEGAEISVFNNAQHPRLRKYKLQHFFNVQTK